MSAILSVAAIILLLPLAYVGFVVYKKKISIKDIRLRSADDAKQLLQLPQDSGPQKYLQKNA